MKRVPLINNDIVNVWVDDEDFDLINQYKWRYHKDKRGYPHIQCFLKLDSIIMGQPNSKEFWVDHKNRDRHDNTRKNLRLVTRQQNNWNKTKHKDAKNSKYIHVRSNRAVLIKNRRFIAELVFNKHSIQIGNFKTEIEAAQAANIAVRHLRGEFGSYNDVDEPNEVFKQQIIDKVTEFQNKI